MRVTRLSAEDAEFERRIREAESELEVPDHPALPAVARLMAEAPSLGNDLRKLLDFNCLECMAGGDWRERLERLCVALGWEPLAEATHG